MKRMRVLVVYGYANRGKKKKTIYDSLYCFKRYAKNTDVYYYRYNKNVNIQKIIQNIKFDAVIYHYTVFALRCSNYNDRKAMLNHFKDLWPNSIKIGMIQDEYYLTKRIRDLINIAKINIVLTLAEGKDIEALYPKSKVYATKFITVLPGYVDEITTKQCTKILKNKKIERDIDIGYRANKLPYSLGIQGAYKTEIVNQFKEILKDKYHIRYDIENTIGNRNVFFGFSWIEFLLRCRTTPACLGGATIIDEHGILLHEENKYMKKYPQTSFEQYSNNFLEEYENSLNYTCMSPRNYECAMTKTCQILLKDNYPGMSPGIDYIELEKDFSNIEDVLSKVENVKYCERIAENAYKHLILSNQYTYKKFANKVINVIRSERDVNNYLGRNMLLEILLPINNFIAEIYS